MRVRLHRRHPVSRIFVHDIMPRSDSRFPATRARPYPPPWHFLFFAEGDPEQAIIFGANFGRDTDTIACMAGYICGAWRGLTPPDLSKIAINDHVIEESRELARSLVDVGQRKARLEVSNWASLAQA